ncbi:MAG: hypothetical protein OK457_09050, partial [Thaumarchaeota archaeon]|nr:hypothetical protein [Nitrososphaerota archaeon]
MTRSVNAKNDIFGSEDRSYPFRALLLWKNSLVFFSKPFNVMQQPKTAKGRIDNTLRAGWMIIFTASVAFAIYGIFDMLIPLWGEESYDGTTYTQLISTQP